MLNLVLTTDKLELVKSSTADLDVHVSGTDVDDTTLSAQVAVLFKENYTFAAASTQDICAVPASNHKKNVKCLSITNRHASTSNDVTPRFNANGTSYQLCPKVTLLPDESLVYREGIWFHYDENGGVYGKQLPVASTSVAGAIAIAAQGDMETGTDNSKAVSPIAVNWHPGIAKFWVIFTGNSTTINASWNMTSITDGTTQATVTIATDFSGSTWCIQATAVAAAATAAGARLASCLTLTAGSVIVFCVDGNATTALADPTSWCVSGLGDQ